MGILPLGSPCSRVRCLSSQDIRHRVCYPSKLTPPSFSQVRGLNATHTAVRAFAADAATVSEGQWAKVQEVVVTDDGKRAVAQLQKTFADIHEQVSKESQVSLAHQTRSDDERRALGSRG